MLDQIQQIVKDNTGVDITPDTLIGTVITDSMEFLSTLCEIENEFEVNLPERDMTPTDIKIEILKQRPELS